MSFTAPTAIKATTPWALKQAAQGWLLGTPAVPAMVVHVARIKGSTPRDTDARMLVSKHEVLGTIGGGHLEWQAIALVRQALIEAAGAPAAWQQTFALGPTLGQCCGGVVELHFTPLSAATLAQWHATPPRFVLDIHGAGHVGQAIVRLLCDIDCRVRWIDQRLDQAMDGAALPLDQASAGLPTGEALAALPPHIECVPTDEAVAEVQTAPWGSHHLVITHRHDLDLAIVDALLQREDIRQGAGWVGLIGSGTKRAAFEHRLLARGHDPAVVARMACPIGLPGIEGKSPQVIAVSVVAQLLQSAPLNTMDAPA